MRQHAKKEGQMSETAPKPRYATFFGSKRYHIMRSQNDTQVGFTYCGRQTTFRYWNEKAQKWFDHYAGGEPFEEPHQEIPPNYKKCLGCEKFLARANLAKET